MVDESITSATWQGAGEEKNERRLRHFALLCIESHDDGHHHVRNRDVVSAIRSTEYFRSNT